MTDFSEWVARVLAFENEAHAVLEVLEEAPSRVIALSSTYKELDILSLKQDDLFRQSLRCIETELYRAAHVLAWAAFMDFLEEKLASDGMKKLKAVRPKWSYDSMEDLREGVSEYQIIEAAKPVGLCTKNQVKALHGLLNKRNECAHPSDYYPGLNETLGYASELLQRIQQLAAYSAHHDHLARSS